MKLEQQEFDALKEVSAASTRLKVILGDLEIRKHEVLKEYESIKQKSLDIEKQLIDKYGQDSVINMQTGEVKQKTNEGS